MKNNAHKDFFNLYHVNESMSEPELLGFAENPVDKADMLYWLRYDFRFREDSEDQIYAEPASIYC